jgi:hypothetical protein
MNSLDRYLQVRDVRQSAKRERRNRPGPLKGTALTWVFLQQARKARLALGHYADWDRYNRLEAWREYMDRVRKDRLATPPSLP